MKIPFTSRIADISSLLLLAVVLYTSQPEKKQEPTSIAPPKAQPPVTVAALTVPTNEAYFDLIMETSECLGENLWIGGKVECVPARGINTTNQTLNQRKFALKELTATGLSTYNSYKLRNTNGTLKAIGDKNGKVFLQLQEGQMQLQPTSGEAPIIVAYQRTLPEAVYRDDSVGNWICE
ncbi:hypothetical protein H8S95_17090 [Pontibacter sp. KCTC 32443]|uniref:hypothetical protein n=1 Tax=Pontibacter TaxID=323449 RepID=UPI00164E580E|nr:MULTISPECIES: hypothetical protein [Pontibacter]MBC5775793.1 hypothetical protein [Pontibacter sp. KCTC 32443]